MALDFYHGHGSPYSWRVWLALEPKAIAYELKLMSFQAGDTRKPEFIALNPRHQVPTIVDDGVVVWESPVILEYLDERFAPVKGSFLAGGAPTAADLVLYPWLGYVKRIAVRRPETKLTELVPQALSEWGKRIESMPFFDKTFAPHWK